MIFGEELEVDGSAVLLRITMLCCDSACRINPLVDEPLQQTIFLQLWHLALLLLLSLRVKYYHIFAMFN